MYVGEEHFEEGVRTSKGARGLQNKILNKNRGSKKPLMQKVKKVKLSL
jgi:hypothetical protein